MPTIINLMMSYRCAIHPNVELIVVQPQNGVCSVQTCKECLAEKDMNWKIEHLEKEKFELKKERDSLKQKNTGLAITLGKLKSKGGKKRS